MKYKCHPNYGWGRFHVDEKIRTKFNGEPMSLAIGTCKPCVFLKHQKILRGLGQWQFTPSLHLCKLQFPTYGDGGSHHNYPFIWANLKSHNQFRKTSLHHIITHNSQKHCCMGFFLHAPQTWGVFTQVPSSIVTIT
jgi:hypothetical protein